MAFGWEDSHLSEFRTQGAWRGQSYQVRRQIEFGSRGVMPAEQVAVGELLGAPRARLWWIYDFGDEWTHRITCKRCDTASEGGARCLGGERAAPPDDCGGAHGYEALLDALADPDHPEHDETVEWLGGPFDPDAFDVDVIDRAVRRLRVGLVD